MKTDELYNESLQLLKLLIAIPSFSKQEQETAKLLQDFLQQKGIATQRLMNNVWIRNQHFDTDKPTLLLNSHHDTVKPNAAYTKDPFYPTVEDGKLYGLGSNDAGGCLVSLLATFLYFYDKLDLNYNLIFAASAEEEISGADGIQALLPDLGKIDTAIVGEPTNMQMAVAEKGLLVVDCMCHGVAGHAARNEGENAIYKAIKDIEWFSNYKFEKESELLGPVKMSVTLVNAGTQHNVVPAQCGFTVDVRINEHYAHEEILETIARHVSCEIAPRSTRLRSTAIDNEHPLVKAGSGLGLKAFGSATLSDKSLMPFPALKIGPGDSARSHTADEYIFLSEIEEGINIYINILKQLL
jgi:acetylornithine deacetylase